MKPALLILFCAASAFAARLPQTSGSKVGAFERTAYTIPPAYQWTWQYSGTAIELATFYFYACDKIGDPVVLLGTNKAPVWIQRRDKKSEFIWCVAADKDMILMSNGKQKP